MLVTCRGVLTLEIAPVPHRATRGEWRRLAVGLLLVTPVVLLVLLPTALGLDRYVVTDRAMEGSMGRGSLVLAREVPPTDLRVGDVISFQRPGGASSERVTRRIVALDDSVALTRADATGATDGWSVPLTGPSYSRVWLGVPWVGYPFLMDGGWLLLVLAAVTAMALSVTTGRKPAPRVAVPSRTHLPIS